MATEQFRNLYSSTLASGYTSGSGSITVTSATGAPAAGNFTLVIRDSSTKAVKLLFRVTSVSGTTFSGGSEGADANANAGDLVDGTMVTVASLAGMRANMSQLGTYANLPASGLLGDLYRCTDAPYSLVFDGANWVPFVDGAYGRVYIPPSAGWSWANQAGAAIDTTLGLLGLTQSSPSTITARTRTIPGTPYTIDAMIEWSGQYGSGNASQGGIFGLSDGTKFVVMNCFFDATSGALGFVNVSKFTNSTSFSANYTPVTNFMNGNAPGVMPRFFRVDDSVSGSLLRFSISFDGQYWVQLFSVSRTDFMGSGPTVSCFGVWGLHASSPMQANLLSWREH